MDDDALVMLSDARLIPGCAATVIDVNDGDATVSTPQSTHTLPRKIAAQLWVTAGS